MLFYTFDIYRIYALLHLIRQIFVPHFWPLFLTLIFNPHFLSSFFTLIFHPHFLPSFLTIGKTVLETWHLRHWLQFWQLRTWIQTIILTWQLIVTLDSIRNSCDVLNLSRSMKLFRRKIPMKLYSHKFIPVNWMFLLQLSAQEIDIPTLTCTGLSIEIHLSQYRPKFL